MVTVQLMDLWEIFLIVGEDKKVNNKVVYYRILKKQILDYWIIPRVNFLKDLLIGESFVVNLFDGAIIKKKNFFIDEKIYVVIKVFFRKVII